VLLQSAGTTLPILRQLQNHKSLAESMSCLSTRKMLVGESPVFRLMLSEQFPIKAGMRREMVDAWKKHWTGRQKDQKRSYVEIRGKCQTKRLHILAEEEYGKRASGPLCNCGRVPMAVAEKGTQTEAPEPEPASLNAVDQAIMNVRLKFKLIGLKDCRNWKMPTPSWRPPCGYPSCCPST
jgi:hypothetical protein